ncbi:unnamed protein product, partial [Allacma fusca]
KLCIFKGEGSQSNGSERRICSKLQKSVKDYFRKAPRELEEVLEDSPIPIRLSKESLQQNLNRGKERGNLRCGNTWHLKSCQPRLWEQVEETDKGGHGETVVLKQSKLTFETKYPHDHRKQQGLRMKLAMLYGCTSIPANLMNSQEFRDVLTFLDPKVRPPDRKTVVSDARNLKITSVDHIKRMINDVQRITICSDIWTKK